jgi:hypothetical protein
VLLMAYTREDCRELSRINRDELIHLGLADDTRWVQLAAGARASAGDLIVARENDHRLVTDPGHSSWRRSRCCTRRQSSPRPASQMVMRSGRSLQWR